MGLVDRKRSDRQQVIFTLRGKASIVSINTLSVMEIIFVNSLSFSHLFIYNNFGFPIKASIPIHSLEVGNLGV